MLHTSNMKRRVVDWSRWWWVMCEDCLSTDPVNLIFVGILWRADLRNTNRCPCSLWLLLLDLLDLLITWLIAFVVTCIIRNSGLLIDEIVSLLQQPVIIDYHPTTTWSVWRWPPLLSQLVVIVHVDRVGLLLAAVNDDFALLSLFLWTFTLIELRLGRLLLHTHLAIVVATGTFLVLRQTTTSLV